MIQMHCVVGLHDDTAISDSVQTYLFAAVLEILHDLFCLERSRAVHAGQIPPVDLERAHVGFLQALADGLEIVHVAPWRLMAPAID